MRLLVRFFECDPTMNREQSFLVAKNSSELPSSNGVISFFLPRTLQFGLRSFEKSLSTSMMLWLVCVPFIINARFVFSTSWGSNFFKILFTLPFLWKFARGAGVAIWIDSIPVVRDSQRIMESCEIRSKKVQWTKPIDWLVIYESLNTTGCLKLFQRGLCKKISTKNPYSSMKVLVIGESVNYFR